MTQNAEQFFSDPRPYLAKDFDIRVRRELVRELLGPQAGSRILDLGCGDGSISAQFVDECQSITWVDSSAPMLEVAMSSLDQGERRKVTAVQQDLLEFFSSERYEGERYDVVLCLGVLAHLGADDQRLLLRKVADALAPGGSALVQLTDANSRATRLLFAGFRGGKNRPGREECRKAAAEPESDSKPQ